MPRQARVSAGDVIYHVINRANGRAPIFTTDSDYKLFEELIQEAKDLTGMRILAYCIMPNHFHFILYPHSHEDLGQFMGWLTTTHVRQYRTRTESVGYGHLYQDRYKSFPVQTNSYALTLIKYIEQNPVRAKLVDKAENWQWSSLWRRERGNEKQNRLLDTLPFEIPKNYKKWVNEIVDEEQLTSIRYSVNKGKPFGTLEWVDDIIARFKLGHTLRGPGRPKKK